MISEQVQAEGRCVDIPNRSVRARSTQGSHVAQGAAVVNYGLTHTIEMAWREGFQSI